jgi:BirA family biotin operon repressor/biotin-[acetyl-CoA-carboxylase] ligase
MDMEEWGGFAVPGWLGRSVVFLPEVDSTNLRLAEMAGRGAPEGTALVADCQTRGRGRLGRTWQSPPGRNLYVSFLLRPDLPPERAPQITLVAGVAVAELLSRYCPRVTTLKWPNDVQIGGKKVCGILTEMRTRGGRVDSVVVGIGVNLNMEKAEFHGDFRETSTSLREETGKTVDRRQFAGLLFAVLEEWYDRYRTDGFPPVRERWLFLSGIVGKTISTGHGGKTVRGRVLDMDASGALVFENEGGRVHTLHAGEITLEER